MFALASAIDTAFSSFQYDPETDQSFVALCAGTFQVSMHRCVLSNTPPYLYHEAITREGLTVMTNFPSVWTKLFMTKNPPNIL